MENQIILFQTEDNRVQVDVRFEQDTVWLTLNQISSLFDKNKSTISRHIQNIFEEGELSKDSVVANFATTANDGKVYQVDYYNLDVIISVGYRVKSQIGVLFRQWATKRLHEYIIKGFTLDDERLKQNGNRYFKELLQRIRDIRSSERNLYQQVTDIYATSIDYNKDAEITRKFFATIQNKLHYATHEQTAAEVIYNRVDAEKLYVGMSNFKNDYVTKEDIKVAKNYLTEKELKVLNLLVSQFLDYAELQALEERPMKMQDWIDVLDRHIINNRKNILENAGTVSYKQAMKKAEEEFNKYRKKQMQLLQSDFDIAIKKLKTKD